jgi:hypothetical protein
MLTTLPLKATAFRNPLAPPRRDVVMASAALVLLAASLSVSPARAQTTSETCVMSYGMYSCVWQSGGGVPGVISLNAARTERDAAESAERDRLWAARCRPQARVDQYGVRRYHYAAPGCEFGRYED